MVTSAEFLSVCQSHGSTVSHRELRDAMTLLSVRFREREVNGHVIKAYLTKWDVKKLLRYFNVNLWYTPKRGK